MAPYLLHLSVRDSLFLCRRSTMLYFSFHQDPCKQVRIKTILVPCLFRFKSLTTTKRAHICGGVGSSLEAVAGPTTRAGALPTSNNRLIGAGTLVMSIEHCDGWPRGVAQQATRPTAVGKCWRRVYVHRTSIKGSWSLLAVSRGLGSFAPLRPGSGRIQAWLQLAVGHSTRRRKYNIRVYLVSGCALCVR